MFLFFLDRKLLWFICMFYCTSPNPNGATIESLNQRCFVVVLGGIICSNPLISCKLLHVNAVHVYIDKCWCIVTWNLKIEFTVLVLFNGLGLLHGLCNGLSDSSRRFTLHLQQEWTS